LIASEVRQSVQDAMRSLRADLAAAAQEEKRSAKARARTEGMSDERATSREQLQRADAAINAFRAQIRTDLRTHVAKGGTLEASLITDLERALDDAAHAVTRGLAAPGE